jgi:hypothetical protein
MSSLMNHSKNHTLVLFTLAMSERPLSISDIQFRSGVSYNTVKRTLLGNALVEKHEGYPATFSLPEPSQLGSGVVVAHRTRPEEGWVNWLNEIRPLLVSITALSKEMTHDELDRKVDMFKSLGTSFLSLADDLAFHHESPMTGDEWFDYLNWTE